MGLLLCRHAIQKCCVTTLRTAVEQTIVGRIHQKIIFQCWCLPEIKYQ